MQRDYTKYIIYLSSTSQSRWQVVSVLVPKDQRKSLTIHVFIDEVDV